MKDSQIPPRKQAFFRQEPGAQLKAASCSGGKIKKILDIVFAGSYFRRGYPPGDLREEPDLRTAAPNEQKKKG